MLRYADKLISMIYASPLDPDEGIIELQVPHGARTKCTLTHTHTCTHTCTHHLLSLHSRGLWLPNRFNSGSSLASRRCLFEATLSTTRVHFLRSLNSFGCLCVAFAAAELPPDEAAKGRQRRGAKSPPGSHGRHRNQLPPLQFDIFGIFDIFDIFDIFGGLTVGICCHQAAAEALAAKKEQESADEAERVLAGADGAGASLAHGMVRQSLLSRRVEQPFSKHTSCRDTTSAVCARTFLLQPSQPQHNADAACFGHVQQANGVGLARAEILIPIEPSYARPDTVLRDMQVCVCVFVPGGVTFLNSIALSPPGLGVCVCVCVCVCVFVLRV